MVHEEEVYEDEDDENEECNWRNDYPDESEGDSDREERYGGRFLYLFLMCQSCRAKCEVFFCHFINIFCDHIESPIMSVGIL